MDKRLRVSLREHADFAARWWWAVVAGGITAAAGVVAAAFGWFGALPWAFVAALLILVAVEIAIFHKVRVERDAAVAERNAARLEVRGARDASGGGPTLNISGFHASNIGRDAIHIASQGAPRPSSAPGVVLLADYVTITDRGPAVEGQHFKGSVIRGPLVVVMVDRVGFAHCTFNVADNDPTTMLFPVPLGSKKVGVVGLIDTTFEHCVFEHVAFAGPANDLAQITQGAGG